MGLVILAAVGVRGDESPVLELHAHVDRTPAEILGPEPPDRIVLLQREPEGIDPHAVEDYLASLSGVTAVHDLHIWAMSTTEAALTVHLVMGEAPQNDLFLHNVCDELCARFGIGHATTQIECGNCDRSCQQAPVHVV